MASSVVARDLCKSPKKLRCQSTREELTSRAAGGFHALTFRAKRLESRSLCVQLFGRVVKTATDFVKDGVFHCRRKQARDS